jgi:BirA family biotin operon repressor/biotin-[acetyl-CoA-carboxylase] ligase
VSEVILPNTVVERCSSTNDLARKLAETGAPHGSWISSQIQEAGRGRLGRTWQSGSGNLYLSIVVRIPETRLWTWIPILTGIGASQALNSLFPSASVQVKWPNDLWCRRGDGYAKLGGILCESSSHGGNSFGIVGIGINCESHPEGIGQPATSLSEVLQRRISPDEVRSAVVDGILESLEKLNSKDFSPALAADIFFRYAVMTPGTSVKWNKSSGKVTGLGPSGELLVQEEATGVPASLFAEDVSLQLL